MDAKAVVPAESIVKPSLPQLFVGHEGVFPLCEKLQSELSSQCQVGISHVRNLLDHVSTKWREEATASAELLAWAKSHKLLKVVSRQISPSLLGADAPADVEVTLHDVKVNSARGRSDDFVYETKTDIRERIPRGLTLMELSTAGPVRKQIGVFTVVRGLKKFTGGMGDEDEGEYDGKSDEDDSATWMKFFSKPLSEVDTVVATEKANGESAHFSVRYLRETKEFLCFAGSKNVHVAFRRQEDLELPEYKEARFGTAKKIARSILNDLDAMTPEHKQEWLIFLASTQTTAIYEFLQPQYQHVELFDFDEPKAQFITFTPSCVLPLPGLDKSANVLLALGLATHLRLFTVEAKAVPIAEVDSLMQEIREQYDKEGSVLYFLDKEGHTVGLLKKKSIWYICVRAIREKARALCVKLHRIDQDAENGVNPNKPKKAKKRKGKKAKETKEAELQPPPSEEATLAAKAEALRDYKKRIARRMDQIQKWLGLAASVTNAFSDLGQQFCDYIYRVRDAAAMAHQATTEQEESKDASAPTPVTTVGPQLKKGLATLTIEDAAGGLTTEHGAKAVDTVAKALYPVLWKQFLKDEGLNDRVEVKVERAPRSVAAMATGAKEVPPSD